MDEGKVLHREQIGEGTAASLADLADALAKQLEETAKNLRQRKISDREGLPVGIVLTVIGVTDSQETLLGELIIGGATKSLPKFLEVAKRAITAELREQMPQTPIEMGTMPQTTQELAAHVAGAVGRVDLVGEIRGVVLMVAQRDLAGHLGVAADMCVLTSGTLTRCIETLETQRIRLKTQEAAALTVVKPQ